MSHISIRIRQKIRIFVVYSLVARTRCHDVHTKPPRNNRKEINNLIQLLMNNQEYASKLEYTPSQEAAIKAFDGFLNDKNTQAFILKGAAGTGKTTITRIMVDMVRKKFNNADSDIALMAPTGRAADILAKRTGLPAATIHRTIYRLNKIERLSNDESNQNNAEDTDPGKKEKSEPNDTGERMFHFALADKVFASNGNTVIFVDEASMVSDNYNSSDNFVFGTGYLLRDLLTVIKRHKIVFIGDYAQLPPVDMAISPALSSEYLSHNYGIKTTEAVLTEIVRQDSGAIIENAIRLRDAIDAKRFVDLQMSTGRDVSVSNSITNDYMACPDTVFDKVIVTYSNISARNYNLEIRRHMFGENAPRLVAGEPLVVSRNYYGERILFNGTIIRVKPCTHGPAIISRTIPVPQRLPINGQKDVHTVTLRFLKVHLYNLDSDYDPEFYILDNFLDDDNPSLGRDLAAALFIDFKIRHPNLRQHTEDFENTLRADPFFNCLLCKYGFALTCHKAQGGEWPDVLVDMSRSSSRENEDYFRWAYTAITRATKHLWLFNAPVLDCIANMKKQPITHGGKFKTYVPEGCDFRTLRFEAIRRAARDLGLECEEDLSVNFQHRITLCDYSTGQYARFSLVYGKNGYTKAPTVLNASSGDFAQKCLPAITAECEHPDIPFDDQGNPSARQLHNHVYACAGALGIKVVNIERKQYQDVYHLCTDGQAVVSFVYNAKGRYTVMNPQSNIGDSDTLLKKFCESI